MVATHIKSDSQLLVMYALIQSQSVFIPSD